MKKNRFTPGPWEWRDGFLCQVDGGRLGFNNPHNGGNRALIAAAPDLLAAAKEAYETLAGWTDLLRQYVVTEGELEELELVLENAIFKAEPDYEP